MKFIVVIIALLISLKSKCQEIPLTQQQQLEDQAAIDQGETEDDSWLLELEQFKKNPINLNTADAPELKRLRILSELQIASLISYRHLLGKLISVYELQAVPLWDIQTIEKILPYVTISAAVSVQEELRKRFHGGEQSVLLRFSQVLERSVAYKDSSSSSYKGSPQKILFRYRYAYKNLMQFGLVADKDAGEQFLKGAQRLGFDFYSIHFFSRKMGIVRSLALGDFTVNMGQGLIQWQSLAFKKGADVLAVKRQSDILKPHSSAGEFFFHRGAGISIQKKHIAFTGFASYRKLSAHLDLDTINSNQFITSFLTSGYYRNGSEIENRNNISQAAFGGNIGYHQKNWYMGINGVYYHFSLPIQKRNEPYNLYAISGNNWYNLSTDFSYTHRNFHLFGEVAIDPDLNKAIIVGLLISIDRRVDMSFVYRHLHPGFQSVSGNAFTENTNPSNEKGFYAGISIRPFINWKLEAYADSYQFPWLRYLSDAPGHGTDLLAAITFTPNKQLEIFSRYRNETKQSNQPGNNSVSNYLINVPKQSWRIQVSYKINADLLYRSRVELVWYSRLSKEAEDGFLCIADIIYKPMLKPYAGIIRCQFFQTNGYNSRVYAYENDVLYNFSIPAFYGEGFRYYLNLHYDITRKISCWLRFSQSFYHHQQTIGSGEDEIEGHIKSELHLQLRWIF